MCRRTVMHWMPGTRTVGRQEYRYYITIIIVIIINIIILIVIVITVPNKITPIILHCVRHDSKTIAVHTTIS
jgi:hypothetical protein